MESRPSQSQVRDKEDNTFKLSKSGKKTPLISENQKSIVSPNPRSKSNPRKKSSERSNDTSTEPSVVGEETDKQGRNKKMSTKNGRRNVPAAKSTKMSKQEKKALKALKKESFHAEPKPARRGFFGRRKKEQTVKGSTNVSTAATLKNTKATNAPVKEDFDDLNELDGGLLTYSENATPRDSIQSTFLKKSRNTMTKSLMMDINIFNYLKEEKGNLGPDEEEPPLPDRSLKPPRMADSMNDFTGLNDNRLYDGGNVYRNTTANLDAKLEMKKRVEGRNRGIGGAFRSVGRGLGKFASFMNPRKRVRGAGSVLGRLSFRGSFNFRSSWGGSSYDGENDIRGVLGNDPVKEKDDDASTDLSVGSDELGDLLTVSKKKKKEPTVPLTSAAAVAQRNSLQKSEGGDHHQDRKVTDITERHEPEEDFEMEDNVKYADMRMSSTHIDTWEESDDEDGKEETDEREPGEKKNSFLGSAMTKSSSMLARVPLSGDSDENIREEMKLNSNQNFKMFTIQGKQPQANDKVKVVNTGRKSILSVGRLSKENLEDYEDDAIRDEEEN